MADKFANSCKELEEAARAIDPAKEEVAFVKANTTKGKQVRTEKIFLTQSNSKQAGSGIIRIKRAFFDFGMKRNIAADKTRTSVSCLVRRNLLWIYRQKFGYSAICCSYQKRLLIQFSPMGQMVYFKILLRFCKTL